MGIEVPKVVMTFEVFIEMLLAGERSRHAGTFSSAGEDRSGLLFINRTRSPSKLPCCHTVAKLLVLILEIFQHPDLIQGDTPQVLEAFIELCDLRPATFGGVPRG